MSRPILGVVSVFAVIATWKEYLWPLLVFRDPDLQPLSVRLPTLQPTTELDVLAEVVSRSALPFCGIEQGAGPGLSINAEVRGCFVAGYRDGTGAEFVSIQTSIEGDPIATIYRTLSGGGAELLIDATQDEFGEKVWRRTTCQRLINVQREVFGIDGCDEGVAIQ